MENQKKSWECIFCGSKSKRSREHVLPDWLSNIIEKISIKTNRISSNYTINVGNGEPIINGGFSESAYNGNILSKKLFSVCESCNGQWMSRLQSQAKPILTPWILGNWEEPSKEEAEIIANWCGMTAIVIAMLYDNSSIVPKLVRRQYVRNNKIPNSWGVWVFRASGFREPIYGNRLIELPPKNGKRAILRNDRPHVLITNVVIGQFGFQVISIDDVAGRPFPVEYGVKHGAFPIFPWCGDILDFKWTSSLSEGSEEHRKFKDDFFTALAIMAAGRVPSADLVLSDAAEVMKNQWQGDHSLYSDDYYSRS